MEQEKRSTTITGLLWRVTLWFYFSFSVGTSIAAYRLEMTLTQSGISWDDNVLG